jgi:hypothetical protein
MRKARATDVDMSTELGKCHHKACDQSQCVAAVLNTDIDNVATVLDMIGAAQPQQPNANK